jgi:hypothetical protein
MRLFTRIIFLCFLLSAPTYTEAGSFNIDLTFSGLTASQESVFASAEATWESIIVGYSGGFSLPGDMDLDISATGAAIDGPGGILGSAGPTTGVFSASFLYANSGAMTFDSADLSSLEMSGALLDVILHEMAHVIGIGTLWSSSAVGFPGFQELYVAGSGMYTGANALAQYIAEFVPMATFVPVELGGGSGTANAHWNEVNGGGSPTGIVGPNGDFANELMTGWLNAPTYISNTTIGSLADLGYIVNYNTSSTVPEPSSAVLFGTAMLGFFGYIRRRPATSAA